MDNLIKDFQQMKPLKQELQILFILKDLNVKMIG